MNYNQIVDGLLVGTYPASSEDIDMLVELEGVTAVLSLQTDEDLTYLEVDWPSMERHYRQRAVVVRRVPVRDFDAEDLRRQLPQCVATLQELLEGRHTVYLHCTAGTGRSPAVAIAYLHWCRGRTLEEAEAHVQSCRPCMPNMDAVRAASQDQLNG